MKIKIIAFFLFLCIFYLPTYAQSSYTLANLSSVRFKIKNAGMNVEGSFKKIKAEIFFDAMEVEKSHFSISVDANSIDTGIESRDKHLQKEDYFHTTKYPTLSFVSSAVGKENGKFYALGTLTIKNVSKEVKIEFSIDEKNSECSFTTNFIINRLQYGVGSSSWLLADAVQVFILLHTQKNN